MYVVDHCEIPRIRIYRDVVAMLCGFWTQPVGINTFRLRKAFQWFFGLGDGLTSGLLMWGLKTCRNKHICENKSFVPLVIGYLWFVIPLKKTVCLHAEGWIFWCDIWSYSLFYWPEHRGQCHFKSLLPDPVHGENLPYKNGQSHLS